MKLPIIAALGLLFLASPLMAGNVQGTYTCSEADLTVSRVSGYDFVDLIHGLYPTTEGVPALPFVQLQIALPTDAAVNGVRVLGTESMKVDGVFDIMPTAAPLPMGTSPEEDPFFQDPAIYGRDGLHPGIHAETSGTWDLAGQDFVTIDLHPLQYNPVSGELFLVTRIDFEVRYEEAAHPVRETYNFSDKMRDHYLKKLKKMAHNPEDVRALPHYVPSARTTLPPGDVEYVIITSSTLKASFQPLADWRNQMGLPSDIIETSWIYSNYTGSTNQQRIRNFIIDANATWGTAFFLMGGDTGVVPTHSKTIMGYTVPNDTYYSDFDEDYKCETFVGRASCATTGQVTTFVNKVLTYEKNPPASYGGKVFFMGFDADANSPFENCKKKIKDTWIPAHITYCSEYDSEPGGHEADVKAYMNDGQNFINHDDHGSVTSIGVGSYHHNTWLGSSEAQNFNCGSKVGNFYTVSCRSGNYASTCWGENYVRDDQGGITYVGNTRDGLYMPGNINAYSNKYDQLWFQKIFDNDDYRAGEALAEHKNGYNPWSVEYKYIFTEINLLGDPGLHFWTAEPGNTTVTHDGSIGQGSQAFTVNVKDGGVALEGALACAMKGTEVYAYGTTDASGNVTLNISPATTGTMTVTVTAQNFRHYEGAVTVTSSQLPPSIDAVSPTCGKEAGGQTVTVTGANFTTSPAMAVTIGGTACTGVNVVNAGTLTCNTPAGADGFMDVAVSNTYGNDTLVDGYRYFPVTNLPFNGADVPTDSLNTPAETVLIASGNAGNMFLVFYSAGGGPVSTPYGNAGLDVPIVYLFAANLNAEGYLTMPVNLPSGYGPLDLFVHLLGLDNLGNPVWSYGGNNPNGTGSVWYHLNN
jgi:hypothetical protein